MIETEDYFNRKSMDRDKKTRHKNNWRSLHTDIINNKFHVTYVNGSDDPDNSEESKERRLQFRLQKLLVKTIENDTITFNDLKILMRLERGLELQQSTIDKLIIVKQGGFGGIIQRLKNLFGL